MNAVTTSNPPFPAAGAAAVVPAGYDLTDLGELSDGVPLLPVALNEAGDVAVYGHPPDRQAKHWNVRGFLRQGARLVECGAALGGVPVSGLSRQGLLCGQERAGGGPLRAWAQHLGNIGAAHWPDVESCAVAVNARGEVAGHVAFEADGRVRRRVFLVNARNEAAFLPAAHGSGTCAIALNDEGTVLYNTNCGPFEINSQAMLWRAGVSRTIPGLPGGVGIWGTALTAAGGVAGRLLTSTGAIRAFWHEQGRTYDLNPGPGHQSEALAAADTRTVVGRMLAPEGRRRAFRWTPTDGLRELGSLVRAAAGWELQKAVAVNAAGLIAGTGLRNGSLRGFLLTPAD